MSTTIDSPPSRAQTSTNTLQSPPEPIQSNEATRPRPQRSISSLASLDKLVMNGLQIWNTANFFGYSRQATSSPPTPAPTPVTSSEPVVSSLTRQRSGASSSVTARVRARTRLRNPLSFHDFHQIVAVEQAFVKGRPLVSMGRVLLKQGRLLKEASGKVSAVRKFYLFSDILVYGTPIKTVGHRPSADNKVSTSVNPSDKTSVDTETTSGDKTASPVRHGEMALACSPYLERQIIVSLGHLTVSVAEDDEQGLHITTGKESFLAIARDKAEREAWRLAFAEALENYREQQARRAREQSQDLTTVVRRVGRVPNSKRGSKTVNEEFRRSWVATSATGLPSSAGGGGAALAALHSITTRHQTGVHPNGGLPITQSASYGHPIASPSYRNGSSYVDVDHGDSGDRSSLHSINDRSSSTYDSLRFWQPQKSLQRKDSMSSDISRRSDVDGVEWVPDDAVEVCMVCHRTRFTMMVRKHHCRRCGYVICWNCSEMRRSTSQPERKVRTCVNCVAICDGKGWMTVEDDGGSSSSKTNETRAMTTPTSLTLSPTKQETLSPYPPLLTQVTASRALTIDVATSPLEISPCEEDKSSLPTKQTK